MHLGEDIEKVLRSKGETASARLDRLMSSALNRITSDVNNSLFPKGLLKPFPSNCLSLMTTTGAKGGLVSLKRLHDLLHTFSHGMCMLDITDTKVYDSPRVLLQVMIRTSSFDSNE